MVAQAVVTSVTHWLRHRRHRYLTMSELELLASQRAHMGMDAPFDRAYIEDSCEQLSRQQFVGSTNYCS